MLQLLQILWYLFMAFMANCMYFLYIKAAEKRNDFKLYKAL